MNRFGVVFSGRFETIILSLIGVVGMLELLDTLYQLFGAYLAGDGFDVSIGAFWIITLLFIMPFFICVAVILRALAARWAFYRTIKRQIVIAEYQPPAVLSAAEAGLLIDGVFGISELAAMLEELALSGNIKLRDDSFNYSIELVSIEGLQQLQKAFLAQLFNDRQTLIVNGRSSQELLAVGKAVGDGLRTSLIADGLLSPTSWVTSLCRWVFKLFWVSAAIIQGLWVAAAATQPQKLFSINYPRYPMSITEPLFLAGVLIVCIVVVLSGFRQTITNDHGLKNWRYVAGLKMYLSAVYRGKFYRDGLLTVTEEELCRFYPYAIALDVEQEPASRLQRALLLQ